MTATAWLPIVSRLLMNRKRNSNWKICLRHYLTVAYYERKVKSEGYFSHIGPIILMMIMNIGLIESTG